MPSDKYFGSEIAAINLEINSNVLTAGAVEDVSIRAQAEHTEFYDPEEISFSEVKRSEVVFLVDFTLKEFDVDIAKYWLQGDGTATSTTLNNSNDAAQYDFTLEQLDTTGSEKQKADITGLHIEELPILEIARGEFSEHDYSGRANDVTVDKVVV